MESGCCDKSSVVAEEGSSWGRGKIVGTGRTGSQDHQATDLAIGWLISTTSQRGKFKELKTNTPTSEAIISPSHQVMEEHRLPRECEAWHQTQQQQKQQLQGAKIESTALLAMMEKRAAFL